MFSSRSTTTHLKGDQAACNRPEERQQPTSLAFSVHDTGLSLQSPEVRVQTLADGVHNIERVSFLSLEEGPKVDRAYGTTPPVVMVRGLIKTGHGGRVSVL